jgi:hypothetical protein
MKVGMFVAVQNHPSNYQADHPLYWDECRLADLAEPLGFDSFGRFAKIEFEDRWGHRAPPFSIRANFPGFFHFRKRGKSEAVVKIVGTFCRKPAFHRFPTTEASIP